MEYRSTGKGDRWHFHRNCRGWPRSDFDVVCSENILPEFQICEECTVLNNKGECLALPPGYDNPSARRS
jgi:hypothetical protein